MSATVDHYGANYTNFASRIYSEVRRETFGEDIGQNGWLTASEQDGFIVWLGLGPGRRLLDVACGSGGPTLRIARITGCDAVGVDVHEAAVAAAGEGAGQSGLTGQVRFQRADATEPLPFPDRSFDALTCVDAVNHLPDRLRVFRDWARVLVPGGKLLFTDPIVVTGMLSNEEIAVRSSIGFFLFGPRGEDERLLEQAGFTVRQCEDATANMAAVAARWGAARTAREAALRDIEGDLTFDGQQEFFRVASRLASERRLSRFAFLAIRV